MWRLLLSIPFFLAISLRATELPQLPQPGEDRVLTRGERARDFFERRASQKQCRESLEDARKNYRVAKLALADLISAGAEPDEIDDKEAATQELRTTLLNRVEECGECATRPIEEKEIRSGGETQYWYLSDGSCYVGDVSGGYDRARQSLREVKRYSKKTGGFAPLLEFVPINLVTGKPSSEIQTFETFPAPVFVALKGGEIWGTTAIYTHLFKTTLEQDSSTTLLRWESLRPPRNFKLPPVAAFTASGRRQPSVVTPARNAIASWFLSADGYIRYFFAADFGGNIPFAQTLGRRTLQDITEEMADRFLGRL